MVVFCVPSAQVRLLLVIQGEPPIVTQLVRQSGDIVADAVGVSVLVGVRVKVGVIVGVLVNVLVIVGVFVFVGVLVLVIVIVGV